MSNRDELYMARCLKLANLGAGKVAPNPLVGAVIVYNNLIIGEGWHQRYGSHHAEVNAIQSVQDKELLKSSTLYVNLEPCNHYGKTPPCTDFIIEHQIPRLCIGNIDPNRTVAGEGIKKLNTSGIKVKTGILQTECESLNRRFFTYHKEKRPYIILKWAQSSDGFIGRSGSQRLPWISNELSRKLVHKWRSEEKGILVGSSTVLQDNPALTVRDWSGKNPLRIVFDNRGRIELQHKISDATAPSLVVSSKARKKIGNSEYCKVKSGSEIADLLAHLHKKEIQSIIVEGGSQTFSSFIKEGMWDEARVFSSDQPLGDGVPAPSLDSEAIESYRVAKDKLEIFRR